jgi:hypothetical protein
MTNTSDASARPWFGFGERVAGYAVPVLNERAVRAAAGILLLGAMVAFMNAWLLGNFQPTRVFVVAFLIDFTVRLFVNPRVAPSLVIGQWMVRQQQPEWTGAPQKRFAWAIGFVLALTMAYLVVWQQVIGPVNILVCAACITLMFFESAFGICIGCKLYNLLRPGQAQLCPGGVCEVAPDPAVQVGWRQGAVVLLYAVAVAGVAQQVYRQPQQMHVRPAPAAVSPSVRPAADPAAAAEAQRCKVPEFAKAIGHEAMWKLHNKC